MFALSSALEQVRANTRHFLSPSTSPTSSPDRYPTNITTTSNSSTCEATPTAPSTRASTAPLNATPLVARASTSTAAAAAAAAAHGDALDDSTPVPSSRSALTTAGTTTTTTLTTTTTTTRTSGNPQARSNTKRDAPRPTTTQLSKIQQRLLYDSESDTSFELCFSSPGSSSGESSEAYSEASRHSLLSDSSDFASSPSSAGHNSYLWHTRTERSSSSNTSVSAGGGSSIAGSVTRKKLLRSSIAVQRVLLSGSANRQSGVPALPFSSAGSSARSSYRKSRSGTTTNVGAGAGGTAKRKHGAFLADPIEFPLPPQTAEQRDVAAEASFGIGSRLYLASFGDDESDSDDQEEEQQQQQQQQQHRSSTALPAAGTAVSGPIRYSDTERSSYSTTTTDYDVSTDGMKSFFGGLRKKTAPPSPSAAAGGEEGSEGRRAPQRALTLLPYQCQGKDGDPLSLLASSSSSSSLAALQHGGRRSGEHAQQQQTQHHAASSRFLEREAPSYAHPFLADSMGAGAAAAGESSGAGSVRGEGRTSPTGGETTSPSPALSSSATMSSAAASVSTGATSLPPSPTYRKPGGSGSGSGRGDVSPIRRSPHHKVLRLPTSSLQTRTEVVRGIPYASTSSPLSAAVAGVATPSVPAAADGKKMPAANPSRPLPPALEREVEALKTDAHALLAEIQALQFELDGRENELEATERVYKMSWNRLDAFFWAGKQECGGDG